MKLPPFGKPLYDLQQQGLRPSNSVLLWIGENAWNKGNARAPYQPTRTLILPPWLSAKEFKWPIIDCSVLIFDTGFAEPDYVDEIAYYLHQFNPLTVHYIDSNNELTIYHKESVYA